MKLVTLKRILKSGYQNFVRNGWLSAATISIMSLVLFVLGNLIFLGAFANTAITAFQSKIDVSVYFNQDAEERDMLNIKKDIESLPQVASTSYLSKEDAYVDFREKHKDNAFIASALEEIGTNPLEASLNIKAVDPSQYASISEFLLKKNYPIVDKINYYENQQVIDRLSAMISTVRGAGAIAALILAFVAFLVAFNTVRLAIYTVREEIGIMRLVGATQWFIRGPFLVNGFLYGLVSAVVSTIIFFPLTWLAAPHISVLMPNFNVFQYFLTNLIQFFVIMACAGIILGMFSSVIAMRRYLNI